MKCLACGGTSLVEGRLSEAGSDSNISFRASGASLIQRIFGIGTRPIKAYGCTHCAHLQLGVEFSESDLEQYLRFEGAQPDVLERLNEQRKDLEE